METVLPPVETTEASAPAVETPQTEPEVKAEEPKPEKTPEQRELERARRKIDRLYRQREEARIEIQTLRGSKQDLTSGRNPTTNEPESVDSEKLTLSREELQELIDRRANELAPTLKKQHDEIEHRRKAIDGLAKSWGKEKFDTLARDLSEAFDGLVDGAGKPKAAAGAIFEADEPAALIEYLADPDNADEAEALSRMSAVQAGRAIGKLELKLQEKAKAKPQPSKAAPPIEASRGSGSAPSMPSDSDSVEIWLKKERARMASLKRA